MWVSKRARGRGLAGSLLVKMNEAYEGRVLLADYVPATIRVYQKTESFTGPLSLSGFRGYRRFDFKTILPPRYPKFEKIKGLLGVADKLLNVFSDLRFKMGKEKKANLEWLETLDQQAIDFIKPFAEKSSFGRDGQDVQWMMKYPWVLNGDPKDELNERYQFSAVDTFFKNYAILIRDNENRAIGFLLCVQRNAHLKIPHAYFAKENAEQIGKAIEVILLQLKINTFTVFHQNLLAYFRLESRVFIFKKTLYRKYLFSKGFAATVDIDELAIQDGDGDVGFT